MADGDHGYQTKPELMEARGLVVLLCGIPGCGKDVIGRRCASSLNGAALSQDEHNGNAVATQAALESLLAQGLSPIFILRNGVEVGDRLPYVVAARRAGYRVTAIWPEELSTARRPALFLASLAGCYGRLTSGGRSGHETLTITDGQLAKPAQVCLNFLQMFRAPSAPGEVDAVLTLPFLQSDLGDFGDSLKLSGFGKGKVLPEVVQEVFEGDFEKAKEKMMGWGTMRRSVQDIADPLTEWAKQQMSQKPSASTFSVPSTDTKKLQRAAKIRAAVEHLVSPYNLSACRDGGTTVTTCKWFTVNERLCPAWPTSYFAGAPQLKKWGTTAEDVLDAAKESCQAQAALQEGDKGVRVQLLNQDGGIYVSPVEPLPEASLRKLRCPEIARACGWKNKESGYYYFSCSAVCLPLQVHDFLMFSTNLIFCPNNPKHW